VLGVRELIDKKDNKSEVLNRVEIFGKLLDRDFLNDF